MCRGKAICPSGTFEPHILDGHPNSWWCYNSTTTVLLCTISSSMDVSRNSKVISPLPHLGIPIEHPNSSKCCNFTIPGLICAVLSSTGSSQPIDGQQQIHYLPKFSILASMFVWRFDCLSGCLFLCLSVWIKIVSRIQVAPFDQTSPNLTQMCILVITRNSFIM